MNIEEIIRLWRLKVCWEVYVLIDIYIEYWKSLFSSPVEIECGAVIKISTGIYCSGDLGGLKVSELSLLLLFSHSESTWLCLICSYYCLLLILEISVISRCWYICWVIVRLWFSGCWFSLLLIIDVPSYDAECWFLRLLLPFVAVVIVSIWLCG